MGIAVNQKSTSIGSRLRQFNKAIGSVLICFRWMRRCPRGTAVPQHRRRQTRTLPGHRL